MHCTCAKMCEGKRFTKHNAFLIYFARISLHTLMEKQTIFQVVLCVFSQIWALTSAHEVDVCSSSRGQLQMISSAIVRSVFDQSYSIHKNT